VPNHHEIPKHYLEGFTEPGTSFVWVFRQDGVYLPGLTAGKNNPVKLGLKRVGLRADGYAAPDSNGKWDYRYEEKLQKIEIAATSTINKIRACEKIDPAEKEALAKYILTMVKRRTSRDEKMGPEFQKALSELAGPIYDASQRAALLGNFAEARNLEKRADYWDKLLKRVSMVQDAGLAVAAMLKPSWEFLKAAPGCYFVTTDNPVGNGGLGTSIAFPISRDIPLTYGLTANDDLTYREITPEQTRGFNSYIILQAEKEIYSPQPENWIHTG